MHKSDQKFVEFCELGKRGKKITVEEVRALIEGARHVFRSSLRQLGKDDTNVKQLLTKFCDAGRRSPPTAAFSKTVPGRPQSGADGNRERRWRLPPTHKFYADEIPATLVEVKYILQTLSMVGGPEFPDGTIQNVFRWLLGHELRSGTYRDPVQMMPLHLDDFLADRRLVQSGHIYPLDRGGRHTPENAFLMLARSNQLQGNNTVPEMIELMRSIVRTHDAEPEFFSRIYQEALPAPTLAAAE